MVISVIGIRFCCQLHLRRLGPSPYLQPTRERESESESDSESDSADTEVCANCIHSFEILYGRVQQLKFFS